MDWRCFPIDNEVDYCVDLPADVVLGVDSSREAYPLAFIVEIRI